MGIITAHSGCDGTKDNSLEFIGYALASGADCLEVDVRLDPNGELSLSHDETGGECVKLEEAFVLLREKPDKKMNCDLKLKRLEIPVYRLASQYHVEKQLIYSGEVDTELLAESRNKFSEAEIYLNIENLYPEIYNGRETEKWQEKVMEAIRKAADLSVSCINAEYHILTEPVLSCMAKQGLRCSAWTVNEEQDIRRMLECGVANVTTRNLKGALNIRKEMARS